MLPLARALRARHTSPLPSTTFYITQFSHTESCEVGSTFRPNDFRHSVRAFVSATSGKKMVKSVQNSAPVSLSFHSSPMTNSFRAPHRSFSDLRHSSNPTDSVAFPGASILNTLTAKQLLDENFTPLLTMSSDAVVTQATAILKDHLTGSVMVVDAGEIKGIVTERDIMLNCVHNNLDPAITPVEQIMTESSDMIFASPEDTASVCLQIIMREGIRYLPIVSDSKFYGLLSLRDFYAFGERHESQRVANEKEYTLNIKPHIGLPKGVLLSDEAEEHIQEVFVLDHGSHNIPHPDKVETGGEDVMLTFSADPDDSIGHAQFCLLGVADGVGSWSFERGVDASVFPRKLLSEAENYVSTTLGNKEVAGERVPVILPEQALRYAYQHLIENRIVGSCTVCMLSLDGSKTLRGVNLGDSGFIVLRRPSSTGALGTLAPSMTDPDQLRVVFRSPQQLHSFNFPFQVWALYIYVFILTQHLCCSL